MDKKIPTKNYVVLAVIVLITVTCVFYARSWYITTKEYYAKNSVMLDIVNEIHPEEINNYTLENPKFILYISSGQNGEIKNFEKSFKKVVSKEGLQSSILYLNSDTANTEDLKKILNKAAANDKIKNKINSSDLVSMYVFENGKITQAIVNADRLTSKQIKVLLKKYGMIEND